MNKRRNEIFPSSSTSSQKSTSTSTQSYTNYQVTSFFSSYGLTNWWSFNSNLKDTMTSSYLTANVSNLSYATDRFGNDNQAVRLSGGFAHLPVAFDFNGDFSIVGWVKVSSSSAMIPCAKSGCSSEFVSASIISSTDAGNALISVNFVAKQTFGFSTLIGIPDYDKTISFRLNEWTPFVCKIAQGILYLFLDWTISALICTNCQSAQCHLQWID